VFIDNSILNLLENDSLDEDISKSIFTRLLNSDIFNKHILIPVECDKKYILLPDTIKQFESWIDENQPYYSKMIKQINFLLDKEENLTVENRKLKFKIENYADYLRITKETTVWHVNEYNRIVNLSQQGITNVDTRNASPDILFKLGDLQNKVDYLESNRQIIIDWYNKEYEILPLWYKRFGHIIKVIMGKRKFKSLFQ